MITADRMAAVDRNAAALGVPRKQLMESSGNAIGREVTDMTVETDDVAIVAGRGNNGGDAFVGARFLDERSVRVHLLGRPDTIASDIAAENWAALQAGEYETAVVRDSSEFELDDPDLVVDALLGTGIVGAPREPAATAIEIINDTDAAVLSVDVPSGVGADTGDAPGAAIDADRIVTFHDEKPGVVDLDAEVTVADIGIPSAAQRFVGPGELLALDREPDSHKGDNGRVFVIGGGPYAGAPALTGQAGLRAGADLAYVATPESVAGTVQGYAADLIVEPYPGDRLTPERVESLLARATDRDAVVIGPGLGDADATLAAVERFLSSFGGRAVVDADALSVVPAVDAEGTLVCTPHAGELRRMGASVPADASEREGPLESFARKLGHVVLLKGRWDVLSDGSETRVNRTGNAGMTVGGTGDVLAGVVGALLAVEDPLTAAAAGAYATGRAGDSAAERRDSGLVASDLLAELPAALSAE